MPVMNVDYEASTVTLAGRTFPAVGLICPQDGDVKDRHSRLLGGPIGRAGFQAVIPAENGVITVIEVTAGRPAVDVALWAATCDLNTFPNDSPKWLPVQLCIARRAIGRIPFRPRGVEWQWNGADPEWVVEFIDRVSRLPFDEPGGPRCEMIRLSEVLSLWGYQLEDVQ